MNPFHEKARAQGRLRPAKGGGGSSTSNSSIQYPDEIKPAHEGIDPGSLHLNRW